jgi:hypothetical protein
MLEMQRLEAIENPFINASENLRCNADNAFVRYADDLNTYVRSKGARDGSDALPLCRLTLSPLVLPNTLRLKRGETVLAFARQLHQAIRLSCSFRS